MSKGIPVLGALLALLPLTSCSSEKWFDERMAEAHTLSPAAIAAFLFGGGFVSEDLTCVSAGVLVSKGSLPFWLAALSCTLGVWVSDSLLYFWGLLGRRGLLDGLRRRRRRRNLIAETSPQPDPALASVPVAEQPSARGLLTNRLVDVIVEQ